MVIGLGRLCSWARLGEGGARGIEMKRAKRIKKIVFKNNL
jgi:hypothetical protein